MASFPETNMTQFIDANMCPQIWVSEYSEAKAKWPPCCRRHTQGHLLVTRFKVQVSMCLLAITMQEACLTKSKITIQNNNTNSHKKITRQIWGIWKLRPAFSPETPNLGQNRWCFVPCDLEIWWMTLENNRASLLCCFKLCATNHSHRWIQTGVTVLKRPIWIKFDDF